MFILAFAFFASSFYVIKYGVGKEKAYFLYPLGGYIAYNALYAILLAVFPAAKSVLDIVLGIGGAVFSIALCAWIVGKVRKNGMQRIMDGLPAGDDVAVAKKFEL